MTKIEVSSVKNGAGYIETQKSFTNLPNFDTEEKRVSHISAMFEREVQKDLKAFREMPEIIIYGTYINQNGHTGINTRAVTYPSTGEMVNNPTFKFNKVYMYNRLSDSELRLYCRKELEERNGY